MKRGGSNCPGRMGSDADCPAMLTKKGGWPVASLALAPENGGGRGSDNGRPNPPASLAADVWVGRGTGGRNPTPLAGAGPGRDGKHTGSDTG